MGWLLQSQFDDAKAAALSLTPDQQDSLTWDDARKYVLADTLDIAKWGGLRRKYTPWVAVAKLRGIPLDPSLLPFTIHCDPMACRNTGWTATSPRRTDVLPCPFNLPLPDGGPGAILPLVATFPQCLVTFVRAGHWSVQAMDLTGENAPPCAIATADGLPKGWISWPAEPVDRTGTRVMTARAITSTDGLISLATGGRGKLIASLVDVDADPFPWYYGGQLAGFTVRQCDCPATVRWAA